MYEETDARADVPRQPGEAGQLEGELERLTDSITRLEQALTPVLGPERPVSTLMDKIAEGSSHIRSMRVRLGGQIDRLNSLMERIEL